MSRRADRNRLAALCLVGGLLSPTIEPSSALAEDFPSPVLDRQWKGIGGCASTACHNAGLTNPSPAIKRGEYTIWVSGDPHREAFAVLLEPRSRRIERLYRPEDPAAKPETDGLCLSCHVHPKFESARHAPDYGKEDGVGCESCHGPAQDWLVPHTSPAWKYLSAAEKTRYGLADLKNLTVRAELCAGCHVGSKDGREVNHDLIAAGHPRLNFELSAYQAVLPRHWRRGDELTRHADFEAKAWIIGRLTSAKAAAALLENRSRSSREPVPEFSEYDCFACHHDLQEPSPTRRRGYPGRKPGDLPWGTWNFEMLPLVAQTLAPGDRRWFGERSSLRLLRREMSKPVPKRRAILELTPKLAADLNRLIEIAEKARLDDRTLSLSIENTLNSSPSLGRSSWDQVAQRYLALASFHQARRDVSSLPRDPRLETFLTTLADGLKYPDGLDSPRGFRPKALEETVRRLKSR